MAKTLIFIIRAYQRLISPIFGARCRFWPSCSSYAAESMEKFGLWRGAWMSIRRLLRCGPWTEGGIDPVPDHSRKSH